MNPRRFWTYVFPMFSVSELIQTAIFRDCIARVLCRIIFTACGSGKGMEVRGGTVIAKGSSVGEKTTTTHVVSDKHGSHTVTRDHYRAKYEWTNPVTGNPMKVEFQVWTT